MNTGNPLTADSLLLFKMDASGRVAWSTAISETGPGWSVQFLHLREMSNGNLLLSGEIGDAACLLITDSQGMVQWQKEYYSLPGCIATEGNNGEIIIAGWLGTQTNLIQVIHLDNLGNIVKVNALQQAILTYSASFFPTDVYTTGDAIYIAGDYTQFNPSSGYSYGIWALKLDYGTSDIVQSASYQFNHLTPACDSIVLLASTTTLSTAPGDHLTIISRTDASCDAGRRHVLIRLDSNLQVSLGHVYELGFVPSLATTTSNYIETNPRTGAIAYCVNYADMTGPMGGYAIIDSSDHIVVQRKVSLNNSTTTDIFGFAGFDLLRAYSAIISVQNGNDYQFTGVSTEFINGLACAGDSTAFLDSQPLLATPTNYGWTAGISTAPSVGTFQPQQRAFIITGVTTCKQVSICDSLKLKGASDFCLGDSMTLFTVYKNDECMKVTHWQFDTSALSIVNQPADTAIVLHFNRAWAGYIYAGIPGCGLTDSLPVRIHGPGENLYLGNDTVICPGTEIVLKPGGNFTSFTWQDGSHDSQYVVKNTGTYYVSAEDYCRLTRSDTILVQDCRKRIYFPNAFTPNHDGRNDRFKPIVTGQLQIFDLCIFNRWGELVFNTQDPANGWNGTVNQNLQPPGTFVWVCKYQFKQEPVKVMKGTVILLD